MKKKVFIAVFGIFLLIIGIIYWQLGGLSEASLSLSEDESFVMVGNMYSGKPQDQKLQDLMEEMEVRYREGELPGTFAICYFGNPDATDSLEVLVGSLTDTTAQIPDDLTVRVFQFPKVIRATVDAHVTVAPSPEEVNGLIREFASVNQTKPTGIYIENYQNESKIVTLVPVRPKAAP